MKKSFELAWSNQRIFDQQIKEMMKSYHIPGLGVSLVNDGQLILSKGYGFADISQKTYIDEKTIFQVGSVSKSLTVWGIMRLVSEQQLNLDKPIETYLTRWQLPDSDYDKNKITLRRILSHTAGLSVVGYLGLKDCGKYTIEQSLAGEYKKQYRVKQIQDVDQYLYSGGGYSIIQLIIEEVTGLTYEKYMEEKILKPLGMYSSTFDPKRIMHSKNIAKPYGVFGGELPIYQFVEKAAAGLCTTLSDMTKFALAHLEPPEFIEESHFKEIFKRPVRALPFALGYKVIIVDRKKIIVTNGLNRGWRCLMVKEEESRNILLLMTNSLNGNLLFNDILKQWYEQCNHIYTFSPVMFLQNEGRIKTFLLDKSILLKF